VLFDEGANGANQVVALGLSDRVQPLDNPTVVVTGSFERAVSDETKLIESLLKSFPDNVVCGVGVSVCERTELYRGAYCTRT